MALSRIHLALDTNVIIHNGLPDEIDWNATFPGHDEIVVVITNRVLKEVEKRKKASSGLQQRRTKGLIQILKQSEPNDYVTEWDDKFGNALKLSLIFPPHVPPSQLHECVDIEDSDSVIAGQIRHYAASVSEDVIFVTNDTLARKTAYDLGLRKFQADKLVGLPPIQIVKPAKTKAPPALTTTIDLDYVAQNPVLMTSEADEDYFKDQLKPLRELNQIAALAWNKGEEPGSKHHEAYKASLDYLHSFAELEKPGQFRGLFERASRFIPISFTTRNNHRKIHNNVLVRITTLTGGLCCLTGAFQVAKKLLRIDYSSAAPFSMIYPRLQHTYDLGWPEPKNGAEFDEMDFVHDDRIPLGNSVTFKCKKMYPSKKHIEIGSQVWVIPAKGSNEVRINVETCSDQSPEWVSEIVSFKVHTIGVYEKLIEEVSMMRGPIGRCYGLLPVGLMEAFTLLNND